MLAKKSYVGGQRGSEGEAEDRFWDLWREVQMLVGSLLASDLKVKTAGRGREGD